MKQVITLLIATVVTLSSFASNGKVAYKTPTTASSLKVTLATAGKVSINWVAADETTTTVYQIEKSVNGANFKTVAILMGEKNDSYFFRDNIKDITGKVTYRVVMVDNNVAISTLTQSVVIL